jgi:hypothetical protein
MVLREDGRRTLKSVVRIIAAAVCASRVPKHSTSALPPFTRTARAMNWITRSVHSECDYHSHPYGEFNMVIPFDEGAVLAGPLGWQSAG